MKRVVSVSLGSSKRDSSSEVEILGERFAISRVGADGDMKRFGEMIRELDGKVDAIGLGGIDRYLWTDRRRYTVRDADRLARNAKITPVVDGSGIKNTLERGVIEYLQRNGIVDFSSANVLLVSAVDRFGMAQTIDKLAKSVVYGDLMFSLGIPIPMRSYRVVRVLATLMLPIVVRLPFKWLYPTGSKQENTTPKYQKYYGWADVIAGDWHLIRRTLPDPDVMLNSIQHPDNVMLNSIQHPDDVMLNSIQHPGLGLLQGKVVITNTVTPEDKQMLIDRGVATLVTGTPQYDGRYYATNVFEGVMISLLGKKPDEVTAEDYEEVLRRMEWKPTVTELQPFASEMGDRR